MENYAAQGMFLNIYEFGGEDLKSNQRGFITAGQKAWLESIASGVVKSSQAGFPIGIFFALLGTGILLALYLQNPETRAVLFSGPDVFIALILTLLAVTGMLSLGLFIARRQAESLSNAQLKSVQGKVSFDQESSARNGSATYFLVIGKKKIPFGDDPGSLFKEGQEYKIFYCKAGVYELILSFEQVNP
ncbi:MAG TPA: hypothetical protein VHM28_04050 [Anaerolineales bacterium]|jgi:tetrahydromethanopterin S-methyltransferase subunit F|nr:hypothetical protein [Anaerolineales bacterium]